ncbi:MAG: hypothetical protein LBQ49_02160 [Rickettsiales bacterium]|jgi:hypothetical protein|nr:hypothetical protein [Rickettsiales bacterium]
MKNLPEKFVKEDGALDTELLLKSYQELEKKIGGMIAIPADGDDDDGAREKFLRAIGAPDSADGYPDDPMFEDMPEVKEKFREIGLTKKQAAAVYKMAAEMLRPAISTVMSAHAESEAMKELCEFFNAADANDEKLRAVLSDINEFAEKNLAPETFEVMASSTDGIKALYNMMRSKDPDVAAGAAGGEPDDRELRAMMKDPKYWRDQDPEFVRKIEAGFKKLYK